MAAGRVIAPRTGGYDMGVIPKPVDPAPISTMGPMPTQAPISSSGSGSKKKKSTPAPDLAAEWAKGYASPVMGGSSAPSPLPTLPTMSSGSDAAGADGAGGAKVVIPEPASMQALRGGEGDGGFGDALSGGANVSGPSRFRQGIGARIPPMDSGALAALRKVY